MADSGASSREAFDAASTWLSGNPAAAGLSNDIKLELYGIFKFVTVGQPTGGRPSIFYPTPRAKYDAWTATHTKYSKLGERKGGDGAMDRYISIAKDVGWKGEGMKVEGEEEEEINFDETDEEDENESSTSSSSRKEEKGGMGPKVSVMSSEGMEEDNTSRSTIRGIHDAVIDDHLEEVKRILEGDPISVNARDEIGNTPLHLAVDRGYFSIVNFLLSNGADKTAKDEDGQTPMDVAQVISRDDIAALLR